MRLSLISLFFLTIARKLIKIIQMKVTHGELLFFIIIDALKLLINPNLCIMNLSWESYYPRICDNDHEIIRHLVFAILTKCQRPNA